MSTKPQPDDYPTGAEYRWPRRNWRKRQGGSLLGRARRRVHPRVRTCFPRAHARVRDWNGASRERPMCRFSRDEPGQGSTRTSRLTRRRSGVTTPGPNGTSHARRWWIDRLALPRKQAGSRRRCGRLRLVVDVAQRLAAAVVATLVATIARTVVCVPRRVGAAGGPVAARAVFQATVAAIRCLWSFSRLWVAAIRRHSERAADLPRR
jgi:hypothetical protein